MAEISTIARPYAEALFRVALEDGGDALAGWTETVGNLSAVAADPDMQRLIGDPRITPEQLYDVFAGAYGAKPAAKVENFLRMLIDNDRLAVLPEIGRQFARLVDAQQGTAQADISSAFPMSDAEVGALVGALEKKFDIKLKPTVTIDEGLIGGVRVVVGDRVLDTSVRSQLDAMKAALLA